MYLVPTISRHLYYFLGTTIIKVVSSFNNHLQRVDHMLAAAGTIVNMNMVPDFQEFIG